MHPTCPAALRASIQEAMRALVGDLLRFIKVITLDGSIVPISKLPVNGELDAVRALRPQESVGRVVRRRSASALDVFDGLITAQYKNIDCLTCPACLAMIDGVSVQGDGAQSLCKRCGEVRSMPGFFLNYNSIIIVMALIVLALCKDGAR
jgi:hypothetical protein